MTRYGTIIGTGRYVPETVHTNDMLKEQVSRANPDLAKVVDAFEDSSGIRARRLAPRDWAASDIAVRAAQAALDKAGIRADQLDMILLGTDTPDYAAPVEISTKAAQKEMILPSLLALLMPVACGLVLGVGGVMGMLVGGLTTGFCVAVFMANAGGAWDNAKKYIESGVHGGKGTDAHKAAVVGDTVGDPFKDTSGPSLNILVKLMSMVSVVVAGLVVRYSLEAMGIF